MGQCTQVPSSHRWVWQAPSTTRQAVCPAGVHTEFAIGGGPYPRIGVLGHVPFIQGRSPGKQQRISLVGVADHAGSVKARRGLDDVGEHQVCHHRVQTFPNHEHKSTQPDRAITSGATAATNLTTPMGTSSHLRPRNLSTGPVPNHHTSNRSPAAQRD